MSRFGARLALALAVPILLAGGQRPLEACSCFETKSVRVAREEATAVFLGVVTARRDVEDVGHMGELAFAFRVSQAWKGISEPVVEVRTAASGTACGAQLSLNEEYLVYAWRAPGSPSLATSGCSRTTTFAGAEREDLLELGPPAWTSPAALDPLLSEELLEAAQKGLADHARRLIAAGHDVNGRSRRYPTTALKTAAASGHVETVRVLLEAGAEVDARKERRTALEDAALYGRVEVVRVLLDAGAEPTAQALIGAASRGHAPVVEELVEGGAPLEEAGQWALLAAVRRENLELAQRLLDAGVPAPDAGVRNSALDLAASKGAVDLVSLFVAAGSRPSQETLDAAVARGDERLARLVADAGRTPTGPLRPGAAALVQAAGAGRLAGVNLALASGVDVNARDEKGVTALMAANAPHVVRRLLDAGADPDVSGRFGRTPLMRAAAARHGAGELLLVLIRGGADVNAVSQDRKTALIIAADSRNVSGVDILLRAGATVEGPDPEGHGTSALGRAIERRSVEVARLLIQAGADPNGRVPLRASTFTKPHLLTAALNGDVAMVDLLLESGARADAKDGSGRSVLTRVELEIQAAERQAADPRARPRGGSNRRIELLRAVAERLERAKPPEG